MFNNSYNIKNVYKHTCLSKIDINNDVYVPNNLNNQQTNDILDKLNKEHNDILDKLNNDINKYKNKK